MSNATDHPRTTAEVIEREVARELLRHVFLGRGCGCTQWSSTSDSQRIARTQHAQHVAEVVVATVTARLRTAAAVLGEVEP